MKQFLGRFSMQALIYTGCATLVLLFTLVVLFNVSQMGGIDRRTQDYHEQEELLEKVNGVQNVLKDLTANVLLAVAMSTPEAAAEQESTNAALTQKLDEAIGELREAGDDTQRSLGSQTT